MRHIALDSLTCDAARNGRDTYLSTRELQTLGSIEDDTMKLEA